jgi:hypothetical protein
MFSLPWRPIDLSTAHGLGAVPGRNHVVPLLGVAIPLLKISLCYAVPEPLLRRLAPPPRFPRAEFARNLRSQK